MQNLLLEEREQISFYTSKRLIYPPHIHGDIELVYVVGDNGTAICDGKKYAINSGDFFIVFPNQVHSYADFTVMSEHIVLIISPSQIGKYKKIFLNGYPTSNLIKGDMGLSADLFKTAYYEYCEYGYNDIVETYITAVLAKILKSCEIENTYFTQDSVMKILRYCSNHYRENITVADVAQNLKFSRSHISHLFMQRLKMSFCDYINSLRLNDAVRLLTSSDYTITEIATMSGFSTIRSFNRAFLKMYNETPSEYRKNYDFSAIEDSGASVKRYI